MCSTIGHVAGTRAKTGFAMRRVDLDHTRSDLGFVLVGRTRFELVTSSVSGWRFNRQGSCTEPVTCCLGWYDPNVFPAFTPIVLATLGPA